MELIGCDEDYVGSVGSYFTVESHVRFLSEVREGEMITVRTRVLGGGGKRMHLFHSLYGGSGRLSCTFETLLLHVNLDARHTSNPSAAVSKKILEYAESHAILGMPEGVGSIIGGGEGM
jgi:carnitine 3-dehydrogenase